MYSFGPIPKQKRSGHLIGTHQKIDRIARKHLSTLAGDRAEMFPHIRDILHFEGSRGPDGVKLKSPGKDEPRHFINPSDPDGELLEYIRHHSHNLSEAIAAADTHRAAFEAAWLAHAVTDGLTPAHHDMYEAQLERLGHGEDISKVRHKMILNGESSRQKIRNNWQYWGAKGIMTTHTLFEAGIAMAAKPYRFNSGLPSEHDIEALDHSGGFEEQYIRLVTEVASLDMYEAFKRTGWTSELARQTNRELLPRVIMAVTLSWYDALKNAKNIEVSS